MDSFSPGRLSRMMLAVSPFLFPFPRYFVSSWKIVRTSARTLVSLLLSRGARTRDHKLSANGPPRRFRRPAFLPSYSKIYVAVRGKNEARARGRSKGRGFFARNGSVSDVYVTLGSAMNFPGFPPATENPNYRRKLSSSKIHRRILLV